MARQKSSFNQIKYQQEYNKQNYDRIGITIAKGKKAIIKQAAQDANQSVNEFIVNAIFEKIISAKK